MQQSVLDAHPWWLPQEWQALGLAILGGVVVTQVGKLWWRDHYGKPKRYSVVAFSVLATFALITLSFWLADIPLKRSIRAGLMWGVASPLIWLAAQWAMRKWAPGLARTLGESTRMAPRTDEVWTDEQREAFREDPTLFGETVVNKPNKK